MSWSSLVPVPADPEPTKAAVDLRQLNEAYSAQHDLWKHCPDLDSARQGWQMVAWMLGILAERTVPGMTDEAEKLEVLRDQFLNRIRVDPWAG